MVAATDCAEKLKAGKKVSKPLMEKKRRARINQCLEQLKSLLESYYSSNIRKRKLEKADILELTVKHLKNLQNYANAASEVSDYHKGFSSCLDNFSHYLLMSDNLNMGDHWMLSQLSNKLRRSQRKPGQPGSTSDSTDAQNGAQEAVTAAAGPEEGKMSPKSAAHRLQGGKPCTEDAWLQSADGEHANTHCSVWRPW